MNSNIYSREEFYKLIWSKPLIKISKELNLPDSQIKKICTEYKIPLPKVGYWKKLEYGKAGEKPSLPDYDGVEQIDLHQIQKERNNSYSSRLAKRTIEIKEENSKHIIVSQRLSKPHPLVAKARTNLSKQRTYKTEGYVNAISTTIDHLSIEAAKANIPRMLRFVDAFIKLLEARGHSISVSHKTTTVLIMDESIPITIREKCNRRSVNTYSWPYSILVPNGKFSVKIANPYSTKEWVEGTTSIEEMLPRIMAGLELYAEKEKKERAEIHRYWEEQRRLQEIKEEELARQRFEKEKVQILIKHAEDWRKSNEVKAFIDQVERSYGDSKVDSKLRIWVEWARSVQRKVDPINEKVEYFLEQYEYQD